MRKSEIKRIAFLVVRQATPYRIWHSPKQLTAVRGPAPLPPGLHPLRMKFLVVYNNLPKFGQRNISKSKKRERERFRIFSRDAKDRKRVRGHNTRCYL